MANENHIKRAARFWETKSLAELTQDEWGSLCDGCGHCCLIKLQDDTTDEIFVTNVACRLLDLETCRCQDYANRTEQVEMCVQLDPRNIHGASWLPETCAYRCLAERRALPDWHPLLTGEGDSVRKAGITIRELAVPEEGIHPDQLEDHIIERCGK